MEQRINESTVMNPFVDWGFKYLFGVERGKIVIFTHSNENGYEDNRGIETGSI